MLYDSPLDAREQLALQSLDFPELAAVGAEDPAFPLQASASSGGDIRFEVVEGPATVASAMLTPGGAGVAWVRAYQDGNQTWESAEPITRLLVIANDPADRFEVWARELFLNQFDELGDPDADLNHNGLTTRQAFIAGISPLDPLARLPRLGMSGNLLTLDASAGQRNYRIQVRSCLMTGDWVTLTEEEGTGTGMSFDVEETDGGVPLASSRFYRYLILLP